MSPAETANRRAQARELASRIVDAPRVPRQFSPAPEAALRASTRRRLHAPPVRVARQPVVIRGGRGRGAIALVLGELALLVALLVLPTFHAAGIDVRGARLLSHRAVLDAAGISDTQSIFTIDGEVVRQRLERLPWVRRAVVETELPSTVRITVTEWEPVLEVRRGSTSVLVAAGGATVDRRSVRDDALPQVPVLVDERALSGDAPPLDESLVRLLPAIAAGFPEAVGCAVADFRWQADRRLAIDSACRRAHRGGGDPRPDRLARRAQGPAELHPAGLRLHRPRGPRRPRRRRQPGSAATRSGRRRAAPGCARAGRGASAAGEAGADPGAQAHPGAHADPDPGPHSQAGADPLQLHRGAAPPLTRAPPRRRPGHRAAGDVAAAAGDHLDAELREERAQVAPGRAEALEGGDEGTVGHPHGDVERAAERGPPRRPLAARGDHPPTGADPTTEHVAVRAALLAEGARAAGRALVDCR